MKQMIAAGNVKVGDKFRVEGFTHAEDKWLVVLHKEFRGNTVLLSLEEDFSIARRRTQTVHIDR
ncbi:hypothetical protein [Cronobacter phage vB_Cdu_VP8]|nr:hypothetical protein [Cronobacter phage vB_Cdu_VP8]